MTQRQQTTFNLIKVNTLVGKQTTQEEIYQAYPFDEKERVDGYKWNNNEKSHDHCPQIWADITAINFDSQANGIIIMDKFLYKLAETPLEALKFARWYKQQGITRFARYGAIMRKIKANEQGYYNKEFDKIEFFNAYVDKELEMIGEVVNDGNSTIEATNEL